MAIEKFIVKIVSELDETGFEKLEKLQADADKSVKNLSNSIKNLFNLKDGNLFRKIFGKINGDLNILNNSLKTVTLLEPDNNDVSTQYVEKDKLKKLIEPSAYGTTERSNQNSFFMSKLLTRFGNLINFNQVFDYKNPSEKFNLVFSDLYKNFENKIIQMPKNLFSSLLSISNSFPLPRRQNANSIISDVNNKNLTNVHSNTAKTISELKNVSAASNIYEKNTGYSINDLQPLIPLQKVFGAENISLVNKDFLPATENILTRQEQFNSISDSQMKINNSDGLSVNLERGAIQVNTAYDNPHEIGEAVRTALTDALDDFILKRGYTKAV